MSLTQVLGGEERGVEWISDVILQSSSLPSSSFTFKWSLYVWKCNIHTIVPASVRLVCEVSCPARGDCLGTLGMRADTGQALGTVMRIVIRGQPCQIVGNRNILFPVVRTHLLLLGLATDVGERGVCTTVSVVIYSSHTSRLKSMSHTM